MVEYEWMKGLEEIGGFELDQNGYEGRFEATTDEAKDQVEGLVEE